MKLATLSLLTIAILLITSCDMSTRTRSRKSTGSKAVYSDGSSYPDSEWREDDAGRSEEDTGGTSIVNTDPTDESATTNASTSVPTELAHCKFSSDGKTGFFKEDSKHLGSFTVCQHSTVETDIYVQLKTPLNSGEQICVIPTYSYAGSSYYIGRPRCRDDVKDSTKAYKIPVIKDRAGYSNYPVKGVMVMRDGENIKYYYSFPFNSYWKPIDAYLYCSQMLLPPYNDPRFCTAFVNTGQYEYVDF